METRGITALVTGATRGIGLSLVGALLEQGAAKVYATGRQVADLEIAAALDPTRVVPLQLDVANGADRFRVAQAASDVDVLFNNAGVLQFGSVLDVSSAAVAKEFEVNCFGLLHMTRAFAPALVAHNGAVVNMLTLVAFASMPGLGAYSASKAAAWSITQSIRADFAKRGVQVFGVFPGAVDTDMIRALDMPKAPPRIIAAAVLDGIQADTEDIFPDPMSQALYAQWVTDHKGVERQFASM